MSIVCLSTHLQIQLCLTYKICNEDRPAKIPCGMSSIMQFDNLLQQIEITSWAGGAYEIFARVGDVSEIERASAASE